MKPEILSYIEARERLLGLVQSVGTEEIQLEKCYGRVLGQELTAAVNIPPFDRSPYDGYAFRAADSAGVSREHPVTLQVLEEIPAGGIPHFAVTERCAVKILTGAPIPEGADAVVPYEVTEFTKDTVTLFAPSESGSNIVRAGEDIKAGTILAERGTRIDPGLAGTLASLNITRPLVYRIPKIGIISTGSELLNVGDPPTPGKIYGSNQYMLSAAVFQLGCEPVVLGVARDSAKDICALIQEGLKVCDAVLLTGGVSVGDYDRTPAAMEMAAIEILYRGVDLKPGMACAAGVKEGKLIYGLSGNPASAMTNFYAIVCPVIKKLCGFHRVMPEEFRLKLQNDFKKKSRTTRLLRGTLELADGIVKMKMPEGQGNVVLSSAIGCNVMAVVPAGSGPLPAGTGLSGFMI